MGVEIKICGITTAEAADAAIQIGAGYAGLVFHPRSPRAIGPEQAKMLAGRLKGRARVVALLADPDDAAIAAAISMAAPDFLQLHGRESVDRVAALRSRFGIPVIKAIAIAEAKDFAQVVGYEQVADMMLFDAKAPEGASRFGGNGAAFDWQLLRGLNFTRPWFLAGGLSADNVGRAIRTSGASAVDVSSGVETEPGVKSADLIRKFAAAARAAAFAGGADA
ncbi:MAG TPA: phosphoribosylanthranilate isomerase [Rhizomicrobium sp.]|nr:phosphoribosylanthranilate isomerase [Rhizomicrobium sp.]